MPLAMTRLKAPVLPAAQAAKSSCAQRFFAIPLDAIVGFEEVAKTARSLATLPTNLDLDHFARPDADLSERRNRLLTAPDVARMSFYERRTRGANMLATRVRRVRQARGEAEATEERHEWRLGHTNCYFKNPSPRIAPLRRAMDRFFGCECPCVGDQFYPPGAFRGWHTDRFGYIGWVVFLVQVAQPNKSSFRYMDPATGDMVVVPDRSDVAYFFRTSAEAPLFWHGVLCESTFRWSQGFLIRPDWRSHIRFEMSRSA